jgi:hypothetical protein
MVCSWDFRNRWPAALTVPGCPCPNDAVPRRIPFVAVLYVGLCLSLAIAAFAVRAFVAFESPGLLDWDEPYYASTAASAAHGLGFFPHVVGYPQIPDMGGTGYVTALYALAYLAFGPSLLVLRGVSIAVSFVALAGITELTRRWLGWTAALAALVVTSILPLFQLTNSIRLDVFAVAFIAWMLVAFTAIYSRPFSWKAYFLLGCLLALGLEFHLHTAAAAFAVGVVCLIDSVRALKERPWWRQPVTALVAGYAAGFLIFVGANVLPDARAYFRTAALARLSAADSAPQLDLTARMDEGRLAQTFLSPTVILRKETARYGVFVRGLPRWERVLWPCALLLFALRRPAPSAPDGRILLAGALVGGAIVFNGTSLLYLSALLPFAMPALGSVVLAFGPKGAKPDVRHVSVASLVVVALLAAMAAPAMMRRVQAASAPEDAPPSWVATVRRLASPQCVLAGPLEVYARHFMAYPRYVSTGRVEQAIGSTYYDLQDDRVAYWREKRPDLVFGPLDEGLEAYIAGAGLISTDNDVWVRRTDPTPGCSISLPGPPAAEAGPRPSTATGGT